MSRLGAVAVKGLFLTERDGHPPPRIVETPAGMLNAIGLQGIGVHRFVRERLPQLRERRAVVIVNVCGVTLDEYVEVARILSDAEGVAAIELNISCPNIKEGGIQFGCSLNGTFDVVSAVRKVTRLPLIPKLTPNVTSVASFARAAEDAGRGRRVARQHVPGDGDRRRDAASRSEQRHGGPERARPSARSRCGWCTSAASRCKIPIIGMGGITDARDALEFIIAGASAVQVGTANFVDPFIWSKLLDGLADYGGRHANRAPRGARRRRAPASELKADAPAARRARRRHAATTATTLAERLRGHVGGFKVGSHLFTAEGPGVRARAHRPRRSRVPGSEVPRHPEHGRERRARRGAAGRVDAQRARERRPRDDARGTRGCRGRPTRTASPLVIAVTVLTSFDGPSLADVGIERQVLAQVEHLALLAQDAGLDGVVASPLETGRLRERCGPDFLIVTPGIRSGPAAGRRRPGADDDRRRCGARRRELSRRRTAHHRGSRSRGGSRRHRGDAAGVGGHGAFGGVERLRAEALRAKG